MATTVGADPASRSAASSTKWADRRRSSGEVTRQARSTSQRHGQRGHHGQKRGQPAHHPDDHDHDLEQGPHHGQPPEAPGPGQRRGPAPERETERTGGHHPGDHHPGHRPPDRQDRGHQGDDGQDHVGRRRPPPPAGEPEHRPGQIVLPLGHPQPPEPGGHAGHDAAGDGEPGHAVVEAGQVHGHHRRCPAGSAQREPAIGSSPAGAGCGPGLSASRPSTARRSRSGASVGSRWPMPGSVTSVADGNTGLGPDGHLDGHLGVVLAPHQVDRAADGGHGLAVLLGQQPDEDVAHHPVGRPVVGGPVPVPHAPPCARRRAAPGVEPPGHPEGRGRAGPAGPGGRAGAPRSAPSARSGRAPARPSRTATRPPKECPTTTTRSARTPGSSNRGSSWRAYSSVPQGSGGGGVAPNPDRSGPTALTASAAIVGPSKTPEKSCVGAPPAVEGENRGDPRPPSPAEQATAGERLQHRHTLPIASASRGTTGAGGDRVDPSRPAAAATPSSGPWPTSPVPAPGGGLAIRGALHRRRRRIGQDPGPHPAGGPAYPGRLGRRRPHRDLHVHPQGRPRAAPAAPPLRRDRVHPGAAGGMPGPGCPGRHLHQLALTLLRRHALDAGRPPPVVAEHRYRTLVGLVGDPAMASAVDTEIGWAKANCLTRTLVRRTRPRPRAGRPSSRRPGGRGLRRLRGLAAAPADARPRRRPARARPTCSTTTPTSPSACAGGTGTSRSTSSRT